MSARNCTRRRTTAVPARHVPLLWLTIVLTLLLVVAGALADLQGWFV